jgi:hypothetical protein
MSGQDIQATRVRALVQRRAELCVKLNEMVVEIAKVDLEIIRGGGTVSGPIAGTIGGTVAGTIGGTVITKQD